MSRQDQRQIVVIIDGNNTGVWDKKSGGEKDSEELKYRPGGLAEQVALGGSTMVENVTVQRLYDLQRDHNQVHWLLSRVGKASVTVNEQPLDVDGNAFGRPIVYKGRLKRVATPEIDSESSDPALVELEISTGSAIG